MANDSSSKGQPVEPVDVLFTPGLRRSTFFTTRSKVSAGHTEGSSGSMTASSAHLVQVQDDGSVVGLSVANANREALYRTFCGETLVESIEFVKLSDEPAFNTESFLLDSDQVQGVSIDT